MAKFLFFKFQSGAGILYLRFLELKKLGLTKKKTGERACTTANAKFKFNPRESAKVQSIILRPEIIGIVISSKFLIESY